MRLEGKTALVTGGGSGIGAATCRRLAAEGAHVAVTDINLDTAREVAGEISGDAYELDVRSTDSIKAAVDQIGDIDVLVNNAGTDAFGFFIHSTPEMWDLVIGVNLVGDARGHARGPAGNAGAPRRVDRQHRVGGGPRRLAGVGDVLGREGGRDRVHEGDRAGERALQGALQRDRARADRDAAPDGRARAPRASSASGS